MESLDWSGPMGFRVDLEGTKQTSYMFSVARVDNSVSHVELVPVAPCDALGSYPKPAVTACSALCMATVRPSERLCALDSRRSQAKASEASGFTRGFESSVTIPHEATRYCACVESQLALVDNEAAAVIEVRDHLREIIPKVTVQTEEGVDNIEGWSYASDASTIGSVKFQSGFNQTFEIPDSMQVNLGIRSFANLWATERLLAVGLRRV
mmetsp:Transcript_68089/g.156224  ORF Transcript_68089/g.156224 Transcript_68089/m.156224 type:complete len:210 (+) Transcript_68089:3-632(+)